MTANLFQLGFDGAMLSRGFWLYVWEIVATSGETVHYVGKTGDKASGVSQSPFNRLSSHLAGNKHSNALKRHLGQIRINPENCRFCFHAYGPLFHGNREKTHGELCDITSGLEKALADAMADAGYKVLNAVQCRGQLDIKTFAAVRSAFATHFDKLSTGNETRGLCKLPTAPKKN